MLTPGFRTGLDSFAPTALVFGASRLQLLFLNDAGAQAAAHRQECLCHKGKSIAGEGFSTQSSQNRA